MFCVTSFQKYCLLVFASLSFALFYKNLTQLVDRVALVYDQSVSMLHTYDTGSESSCTVHAPFLHLPCPVHVGLSLSSPPSQTWSIPRSESVPFLISHRENYPEWRSEGLRVDPDFCVVEPATLSSVGLDNTRKKDHALAEGERNTIHRLFSLISPLAILFRLFSLISRYFLRPLFV